MGMHNVLCESCSSRPAKLVMFRRRRGDTYRTFVCPECANERARLVADTRIDLGRIMTGADRKPAVDEVAAYSCGLCGATLADVVVDGRPGCCLCYGRFPGEIENVVEAAQGATYHLGKIPHDDTV